MRCDLRHLELNARCAEAIRYAEDTADELRAYCTERARPQARLDPERLRQLRASRAATIAGLGDADPDIRLAALSLFGPEDFASPFMAEHYPNVAWVYGLDAAPAVLAMALADPVREVQHHAAGSVENYYPGSFLPDGEAQQLALVVLRSDDIWLRHTVYRTMVFRSRPDNWSFASCPISFKYLTLPMLFDADHLRELVGLDADGVPIPVPPPTPPVARSWWRRLLWGRSVK